MKHPNIHGAATVWEMVEYVSYWNLHFNIIMLVCAMTSYEFTSCEVTSGSAQKLSWVLRFQVLLRFHKLVLVLTLNQLCEVLPGFVIL